MTGVQKSRKEERVKQEQEARMSLWKEAKVETEEVEDLLNATPDDSQKKGYIFLWLYAVCCVWDDHTNRVQQM